MQPLYPNRINWQNLPSFDTPLGASNLNKMDYAIYGLDQRVLTLTGYQDSASQSAKNAKASEVNAKASELNASASEELARQYAEQAFSGTPEGYEQLVEDVRLIDIKTTTDTTLDDSKAGGYKLVYMSGKSVQNGTPTPDSPIAINNTADSVDIIPGYYGINDGEYATHLTAVCNKNKIPCVSGDLIKVAYDTSATTIAIVFYNDNGFLVGKYGSDTNSFEYVAPSGATYFNFYINDESTEIGKITLTINGKYVLQIKGHGKNFFSYDKETITLVKSSPRYKSVLSTKKVSLPSGTYKIIFSDLVIANSISTLRCNVFNLDSVSLTGELKLNRVDGVYQTTLTLKEETVIRHLYIYLGQGDNDNATATFSEIMIVKDDVTDYTFEEYKETVATVLLREPLRYGDLLYRTHIERNRASITLAGVEGWTLNNNASNYFKLNISGMKASANAICSNYIRLSALEGADFGFIVGSYLNIKDVRATTVEEFKALLTENPAEFEYELAEPIIEELDNDSKIALNSLETFDTVTYINVDSRTQPKEIKSEYGTSIVGARTLKNELKNDTLEIKYNELAVALVATGSEV